MKKVSVIVPVYNTSNYLEKCITSLLNQTLQDIEIIMVNDGSLDNSREIIEEFQKKDNRILLFNKENGGQASARNLGLSKATGEYVVFLDSDDYISPVMYEQLYNKAKSMDYDIVLCNYYLDYNGEIKENHKIFNESREVSSKEYILSTPSPVNKIIKREFLKKNSFQFPEGFIYEDLASIPILGTFNPKIYYIDEYLYYYVQSPTSTMRNNEYKTKFEDIFKAISYLYQNIYNKGFNEELEYLLSYHFLYLGSLNFYKYKKYEKIDEIASKMKEYFPNWFKNKYVLEKIPKSKRIYMKLFYYKKYKFINVYRQIFHKKDYLV